MFHFRQILIAFAALIGLGCPAFAADGRAPLAGQSDAQDEPQPDVSATSVAAAPDDQAMAADPVIDVNAVYTAELWHNSGGVANGWRYLDNLDITATLDLEQAIGWHGAQAFGYLLYNNGKSLSELSGDSLVASNIETGTQALRLYEAWVDAPITEAARVKLGLYDLNTEFDVLDSATLFIGSSHGTGEDIGQSGQNGPSIFPATSLALRLHVDLADNIILRSAVFDGVPGDPDHYRRTAIKLSNDDGALLISELAVGDADARLLAGIWGYTSRFDRNDGFGRSQSQGFYLRGELRLAALGEGDLRGFARLGTASGATNHFNHYLSTGLVYTDEHENQLGLAVAYSGTSDSWRAANGGPDEEVVIEATYSQQLLPWLAIQPDVQYIINPSGQVDAASVDDALAIGLRIIISH